jgi:hypothetical protein
MSNNGEYIRYENQWEPRSKYTKPWDQSVAPKEENFEYINDNGDVMVNSKEFNAAEEHWDDSGAGSTSDGLEKVMADQSIQNLLDTDEDLYIRVSSRIRAMFGRGSDVVEGLPDHVIKQIPTYISQESADLSEERRADAEKIAKAAWDTAYDAEKNAIKRLAENPNKSDLYTERIKAIVAMMETDKAGHRDAFLAESNVERRSFPLFGITGINEQDIQSYVSAYVQRSARAWVSATDPSLNLDSFTDADIATAVDLSVTRTVTRIDARNEALDEYDETLTAMTKSLTTSLLNPLTHASKRPLIQALFEKIRTKAQVKRAKFPDSADIGVSAIDYLNDELITIARTALWEYPDLLADASTSNVSDLIGSVITFETSEMKEEKTLATITATATTRLQDMYDTLDPGSDKAIAILDAIEKIEASQDLIPDLAESLDISLDEAANIQFRRVMAPVINDWQRKDWDKQANQDWLDANEELEKAISLDPETPGRADAIEKARENVAKKAAGQIPLGLGVAETPEQRRAASETHLIAEEMRGISERGAGDIAWFTTVANPLVSLPRDEMDTDDPLGQPANVTFAELEELYDQYAPESDEAKAILAAMDEIPEQRLIALSKQSDVAQKDFAAAQAEEGKPDPRAVRLEEDRDVLAKAKADLDQANQNLVDAEAELAMAIRDGLGAYEVEKAQQKVDDAVDMQGFANRRWSMAYGRQKVVTGRTGVTPLPAKWSPSSFKEGATTSQDIDDLLGILGLGPQAPSDAAVGTKTPGLDPVNVLDFTQADRKSEVEINQGRLAAIEERYGRNSPEYQSERMDQDLSVGSRRIDVESEHRAILKQREYKAALAATREQDRRKQWRGRPEDDPWLIGRSDEQRAMRQTGLWVDETPGVGTSKLDTTPGGTTLESERIRLAEQDENATPGGGV